MSFWVDHLKMVEVARKEVLDRLQVISAAQLEELCTRSHLTVVESKKGNQKALFNVMMRHLTSQAIEDSEDEGQKLFEDLLGEMKVMLGEDGETGIKKESETSTGNAASEPIMKTRVELHKLREFKITGGTVGSGDNALGYISLIHQMREGKAIGYSGKEVMSGVIKAMKAASSIRSYCEGHPDLTEEKFMKLLRSHYNVKDSATLLTELSNGTQEPKETEMNYVLRLMGVRNNVITLSRDEGCPLDEVMVQKRFMHAVAVGLKKDAIRLELQTVLKQTTTTDEDLLDEIRLVVARDAEHQRKMNTKNIGVNQVDAEQNAILVELKQLTVKVNELSVVKDELQQLKRQMTSSNGGAAENDQNRGYRQKRKFVKCAKCEQANAFCTHCSVCGDGGHKRNECEKNLKPQI